MYLPAKAVPALLQSSNTVRVLYIKKREVIDLSLKEVFYTSSSPSVSSTYFDASFSLRENLAMIFSMISEGIRCISSGFLLQVNLYSPEQDMVYYL